MADGKVRLLQLCSFHSIYNDNLQNELLKSGFFSENFSLSVIYLDDEINDISQRLYNKAFAGVNRLQRIKCLRQFNKNLSMTFESEYDASRDIVNIQFASDILLFIISLLKKSFARIIVSYWGSDLFVTPYYIQVLMTPLLRSSKYITVETEKEKYILSSKFHNKFNDKIKVVRFGLTELEYIDNIKQSDVNTFVDKYDIDLKRNIIVIGYNRREMQQHIEVIKSIVENDQIDKTKIQIIIPWTYGQCEPHYKEQIMEALGGKIRYCFIDEFMSDVEVAVLRAITPVLIQVQTTDALSSSMLETLYAGNMVITGSWLPYDDLYDMGIKMVKVDSASMTGDALAEVVCNPVSREKTDGNRSIISQYSSWTSNLKDWIELYI